MCECLFLEREYLSADLEPAHTESNIQQTNYKICATSDGNFLFFAKSCYVRMVFTGSTLFFFSSIFQVH